MRKDTRGELLNVSCTVHCKGDTCAHTALQSACAACSVSTPGLPGAALAQECTLSRFKCRSTCSLALEHADRSSEAVSISTLSDVRQGS